MKNKKIQERSDYERDYPFAIFYSRCSSKAEEEKIFLTVGEAMQEMGTSREVIYKMMTYPDFPMNYMSIQKISQDSRSPGMVTEAQPGGFLENEKSNYHRRPILLVALQTEKLIWKSFLEL